MVSSSYSTDDGKAFIQKLYMVGTMTGCSFRGQICKAYTFEWADGTPLSSYPAEIWGTDGVGVSSGTTRDNLKCSGLWETRGIL